VSWRGEPQRTVRIWCASSFPGPKGAADTRHIPCRPDVLGNITKWPTFGPGRVVNCGAGPTTQDRTQRFDRIVTNPGYTAHVDIPAQFPGHSPAPPDNDDDPVTTAVSSACHDINASVTDGRCSYPRFSLSL